MRAILQAHPAWIGQISAICGTRLFQRFFFFFVWIIWIQTPSLQGVDDVLPGAGCQQEQALVKALRDLRVQNISDVRKCSSGRGCVTWMLSCIEHHRTSFWLGDPFENSQTLSELMIYFFCPVLILSLFSPFSFPHLEDWL